MGQGPDARCAHRAATFARRSMSLKHVAIAFVLLLVLAITWRLAQSEWAQGLRQPPAKPAAPIQFDNGTVRQYDSPASVAARNKGQPLPLGTLRKCQGLGQRVGEIGYTNSFCPPGTRELKLEKGTLNVVEAGPGAAPAPQGAAPGAARPQPTLRELAVERAANP